MDTGFWHRATAFFQTYKLRIAAIILSLYCLPPKMTLPLVFTLDGAWTRALNYSVEKKFIFGSQVIFAYGPLGFLSTNYGEYINHLVFLIYNAFLFAGCYHFMLRYVADKKGWLLLMFIAVFFLHLTNSSQVLFLVFALYSAITFRNQFSNYFELVFCAVSGVLLFFIKLNYGIVSMAILLVMALITLLKNRKTCAVFLAALIGMFCTIYFSVHLDLWNYVANGLLLIRDYDAALIIPIEPLQFPFLWAILLITVFAAILILYALRVLNTNGLSFSKLIPALILGMACFLLYKNGFTRADRWHWRDFFTVIPFLLNTTLIVCGLELRLPARIAAGFCTIVAVYSLFYEGNEDHLIIPSRETVSTIAGNFFFSGYFSGLFQPEEEVMMYDRLLPPALSAQIGQSTVDVIPFDHFQLIYFNKLNYLPRPTLQSAYSERLDSLNAVHFASADRPFILFTQNIDIDNRYPFWDESITKAGIHLNYDYFSFLGPSADSITQFAYILLRSNPDKHAYPRFDAIEKRDVSMGDIVKIHFPDSVAIYMKSDIRYTVPGRIRRLLYQAPLLDVTLYFDDGTMQTYRAICPVLEGPVLINKAVLNSIDLKNFFTGNLRSNKNITGFSFNPAGEGFARAVTITFLKFSNY